jgi:hypothetical protein
MPAVLLEDGSKELLRGTVGDARPQDASLVRLKALVPADRTLTFLPDRGFGHHLAELGSAMSPAIFQCR